MKRSASRAAGAALIVMYGAVVHSALAVDTVSFSASAAGITKSIATWGYDTSWADYANVQQCINSIGVNNIGIARLNFFTDQPLVSNGNGTYSLNSKAQSEINTQLGLISLANPGTPLTLMATVGVTTDPSYLSSSAGINVNNWAQLVETTQQYINSQPGFTNTKIAGIEPFNEPDYWSGEGTPTQLNSVIQQLKSYAPFANTSFIAASTLNSDNAQSWYNQIPALDAGSSHLLGGSLTSYINFIQSVNASGKSFINPEMHSLAEAIVGANYGQSEGIFWADDLQARGLFVQASAGKQLAYSQNLTTQSAAAVYRAPSGSLYAFAGGLERFGAPDSYRFASDRNAYFNGIGPMQSYALQADNDADTAVSSNQFTSFGAWSHQGAYANIDFGSPSVPGLAGYRWEIQNVQTGQVLTVAGSSTSNGAVVNTSTNSNSANQLWNITRTQDGYLDLFNANSGLTLDTVGASFTSGVGVQQYGTASDEDQQWYISGAGNGNFNILNGYSSLYLTGGSTNCTQSTPSKSNPTPQQWRFVLANPTSLSIAHYKFAGNVQDSTGSFNALVNGTATYGTGPTSGSQSLNFDGSTTSVSLPTGVSNNSSAITALVLCAERS